MISVIIPLYNKEPIIERSLQSVLSQDYDDFEVIVVNDGSTDKSAEIVKQINDPRITLIEQENGGPSKARNTGVKYAKGDWIVFLDADDEFFPGALNNFCRLINHNKSIEFFCCNFFIKRKEITKSQYSFKSGLIKNLFKTHYFGNVLPRTGTAIYTKDLILLHPFNETLRRYEDLEHIFRLYKSTNLYVDDTPVLIQNQDYASASQGRKNIKEDFVGHLDFRGKSFWQKMCLYKLYLGEREHYPEQIDKLYPQLRYRYDFLLLYKILNLFSK